MKTNIIEIANTKTNCTPILIDAIGRLEAGCENIISFKKGSYRFEKDGCYCGTFFPSNNASGVKNVIFPLLGKENVTIDGNGSEFIFCDRVFPFILQDCTRVTLKNFTVDFSFARHAQGTVAASDKDGFEITMSADEYGYSICDGAISFKVGSDTISSLDKKFFIRSMDNPKIPVAYLFVGDCRDSKENLAAGALDTDAVKTENGIYFKYREDSKKIIYPVGEKMFIGNDENRENDVIFTEFCSDIRIENVTILRGAGMGVIAQMSTDIAIDNISIKPKDGSDVSVTADALHFVNCDGNVSIKNSTIIQSIDDALNIHGAYTVVDKVVSENAVTIRFGHPEQNGLIPYLVGDTAYFIGGSAVVADVLYKDNRETVTLVFDSDISDMLKPGTILENADRMATLVFENNTVIGCPHMRLSSKDMTVKGNTLSLDECDILVNDLFDYWYESGSVDSIIIADNKFISKRSRGNIHVRSCRSDRRHKNVVIENNELSYGQDKAISVEATENTVIRNNKGPK